jgi:hypothetical protein
VDNSRFLMLANSISAVDSTTYSLLERLDLGQTVVSAVVARDGKRLWRAIEVIKIDRCDQEGWLTGSCPPNNWAIALTSKL